jgi:hypothetical protein
MGRRSHDPRLPDPSQPAARRRHRRLGQGGTTPASGVKYVLAGAHLEPRTRRRGLASLRNPGRRLLQRPGRHRCTPRPRARVRLRQPGRHQRERPARGGGHPGRPLVLTARFEMCSAHWALPHRPRPRRPHRHPDPRDHGRHRGLDRMGGGYGNLTKIEHPNDGNPGTRTKSDRRCTWASGYQPGRLSAWSRRPAIPRPRTSTSRSASPASPADRDPGTPPTGSPHDRTRQPLGRSDLRRGRAAHRPQRALEFVDFVPPPPVSWVPVMDVADVFGKRAATVSASGHATTYGSPPKCSRTAAAGTSTSSATTSGGNG